ncbi:probable G-protein coupled receptor 21 [Engraulis encrasicolus]|uniref:probable G-protein coupled receptor 21 n=1 Tax=Engraulis encrasicolus TaxID=184585 RepID=UPI002FD742C8
MSRSLLLPNVISAAGVAASVLANVTSAAALAASVLANVTSAAALAASVLANVTSAVRVSLLESNVSRSDGVASLLTNNTGNAIGALANATTIGLLANVSGDAELAANVSAANVSAASVSGASGVSSGPFCLLDLGYSTVLQTCVLEVAVIVLLSVLIVGGNLLVLLVFHCAPLVEAHGTSAFIQTMALADLLLGLSCLIPALSLLGHLGALDSALTCRAFGYLVCVLKGVSMASLACVSVERYVAVTRPLSYAGLVTACRLRVCVVFIWLYSALVFLPAFLPWGGKPGYHGDVVEWCARWETRPAFTAFIVTALYAPATVTVCYSYAHIFRICRQHTRQISERRARYAPNTTASAMTTAAEPQPPPPTDQHHPPSSPAPPPPDKRYATVLFRLTSVFYLLWLPYILYFLLESAGVYRHAGASFLTTWLAISNSFFNCLIYSVSNAAFRRALKRLCSLCTATRHTHAYTHTHTHTRTAKKAPPHRHTRGHTHRDTQQHQQHSAPYVPASCSRHTHSPGM